MERHAQALLICTVVAVFGCSVVGEIIAPTRALSPLPSFVVFALLAAICAPTLYVATALCVHALPRSKKETTERAVFSVAFVVTLGAGIAFALHARTS
uniref:hypothetical protein n=1 Tax=Horticoccus sp. 23ND18S-11 TaxID=3391832 RepID=UPI0039C991E2